jgi:polysaccharide export outer membrane protein
MTQTKGFSELTLQFREVHIMSYLLTLRLFRVVSLVLLSSGLSASAQHRQASITDHHASDDVRKSAAEPKRVEVGVSVADYVFGSGDVVEISVVDLPEVSGTFQVSDTGYIALPLLGQVKAEGLNGMQLTQLVSDTLKSDDLLVEPIVIIAIDEYHSRTVLVLGAVVRPDVYPLRRPTTLLDIISLAGGLAPNAGNTVTIARKEETTEANGPIVTVDLAKLVRGSDPLGNIEVHAGDVVNVSTAPVIYVVGAVNKQGGFVMGDPGSGVTVIQAIALAEGLQSIAAPKQGVLIRRSQEGKPRQEIPVDIAGILQQKGVDQLLQPNDILFVPESGSKKTLHAMARVAEGVVIYGAGLRIGY